MQNEWLYDPAYSSYFYLKSDGSYANQEWQKVDGKWVLFQEVGVTWLKMSGKVTII